MELKKPLLVRDILPKFIRKAVIVIIALQLIIIAATSASLILILNISLDSMNLWLVVGAVFVVTAITNIMIFAIASRPAKALLAAVIHVSGEPTASTPPNPNDKSNAKSGLGIALQTIYQLSGSTSSSVEGTRSSVEETAADKSIKQALDSTPCGFVVMDCNKQITYYNKNAPIHIDPAGKATLTLVFNGSDSLENWLAQCDKTAVKGEHIWTRIPDRLADEEGRRFYDVIASYDKGAEHEVVLSLIDRTAQYSVGEQDLDFIAFAAHELRGPITVIRGYLDVLEDELSSVLQDDQHELFRRLTVSANRLAGYINNILNTSRYDRRHLKVNLAEDKVAAIYETIQDDMQLRAKSQNRVLNVNLPIDLPTVAADRTSIGEVIVNLIDNAIKYSNEGGTINVTAEAKGDYVEIHVQDFGIGMPGNVVSNLFQKFYRSHRSRETVAGTGIGLYISKAIVESHGGTISVISEEGKGSTFTVALPIYATVASKLGKDSSNEGLIEHGSGWIKNHNMYRG